LWEIKNAKWQDAWLGKFKDDMSSSKVSVGVIVVQDLPERFGEIYCASERIFAIKPRTVKLLARLLRDKIIEIYEMGRSQKFSNEKIEAFYNYLTSGEFKDRLLYIMETYKTLRDLHEKDKNTTIKRWGKYDKQLEKMMINATSFIGELQGLSDGEIGDIPLLGENEDEDSELKL